MTGQRLGIVDAVWSEDSDVFLFRGEALLRFHYDKPGKKDNVMARRYRISSITEKFRLMDWRGVILFAILVGGDYAMKGLPGCGPKIALKAVSKGLGAFLIDAFKMNKLDMWRQRFREFLDKNRSKIHLPAEFPEPGVLKNYIEPNVSSAEILRSGIQWDLPIDQPSLKVVITTRFNFSVQEYIRWVVRMLLSRQLLAGSDAHVDELELQMTRGVLSKESGNINLSRVSFLIGSIVPSRNFLETWPVKDTIAENRIEPYFHEDRIECDLPDIIIAMAAPELLQDKMKCKPKPIKADVPAQNRRPGRPRKDAVRLGDMSNNLASGQVGLKRKRGRPRKHEFGDQSRIRKGPPLNDKSLISGTKPDFHTSSARYEQRGLSHDEEDDEFPDLMDLTRKKSYKIATSVGARPTKVIKRSRQANKATARLNLEARSLETLQQEKRTALKSDASRELRSENAPRNRLNSHEISHQQVIEGESWSQAIDLTGD